ncbi:response regulator transcription factor [Nordella sp. HKS 07]|uniref:response regulator n=1 Tax=Nordella sp. HKS 07 TaxID=2712222 RepID=UPI0013E1BF99|nr:response regulator transcription factor [Nordella sp. HKS 07]QIG50299.1 response regulator transcription factor [Nordella sp. HKS 07]
MRILLIEDDKAIGGGIRDHAVADGHAVDWATSLAEAWACKDVADFGLVLLDLSLPDGSGRAFLEALRARKDLTPVIILTARDQISDRIAGLNKGADDYLVKPFDLGELSARIHAVARRYGQATAPVFTWDGVVITPAERRIVRDGKAVELTAREWAVLDRLLLRPKAIVSKVQIEEALYAFGAEVESNTVEVYVSRLRKKIGHGLIVTARGVGYRLAPQDGTP